MYKMHVSCRACGYGTRGPEGIKAGEPQNLIPVFNLGIQPLANDFRTESEERSGYAPLKVLHCPKCSLAQLSVTVRPEVMYRDYPYVTSPSKTMVEHFKFLSRLLAAQINAVGSVLEIGSNDGLLLETFRKYGWGPVLGIDPAENLTKIAVQERKVESITGLFNTVNAREARQSLGRVNVVIARHVFCHVDDWKSFIDALGQVINQETVVAIEVPYLGNLLDKTEFDTIYHEHLAYFSLRSMEALLESTPLRMQEAVPTKIHGGAMIVLLRSRASATPECPDLRRMIDEEKITVDRWREFSLRAHDQIEKLGSYVRSVRAQGKRVVGLGASAKSTVWLNACGFTRNDMEAVYDNTPQKQYKFCPGTDIPVKNEGAFYADAADYAICFAWNFRAEIIEKNQKYLAGGGKLVFPVPNLEVVGA